MLLSDKTALLILFVWSRYYKLKKYYFPTPRLAPLNKLSQLMALPYEKRN